MKLLVAFMLFFVALFGSIDINKADIKGLITLNGVGKTKAKAIIKYRKIKCFSSIKELIKVRGIGEKILHKNRTNLSVSPCK